MKVAIASPTPSARLYGLVDPQTPSEIRYVGRTTVPNGTRLGTHLQDALVRRAPRPVCRWIRQLVENGRSPDEIAITEFDDEATAIRELGERGHRLLNVRPGGERGPTKGGLGAALIAQLGTVPDSVIASKCEVHRRTVQRRRAMLGIPPHGPSNPIDWSEADSLLGTAPDRELAEQMDVSVSAVQSRRRSLGIASWSESARARRAAGDRPPAPGAAQRQGRDEADSPE